MEKKYGVMDDIKLIINDLVCFFCLSLQMVLRYNTPSPKDSTSFALKVKTDPVNCTKDSTRSVTVHVDVR